jgi:hypothetical protein
MERLIDEVRTSRFNIASLTHMLFEARSVYLRCTTDYHNAKAKRKSADLRVPSVCRSWDHS